MIKKIFLLRVVPTYKDEQLNNIEYMSTLMRIERSDVSSMYSPLSNLADNANDNDNDDDNDGLITGYARNVASFHSHQSAYTFYVIYLLRPKVAY